MASEDNEISCCESDPNFAVICAFLDKFGVSCGITNIDFVGLQGLLEDTQEVSRILIDLHVKLMRRAGRKSVTSEKWEKALIKFCHTYNTQDAWEIERFGYKKAKLSSKIRILKELLEMQFDCYNRFKTEINKISANELRSQPLGYDKMGYAYWFLNDYNYQIRVYREDPEDETWTLVAKDKDGLLALIAELNGEEVKHSTQVKENEDDGNSLIEKPLMDTGQEEINLADCVRNSDVKENSSNIPPKDSVDHLEKIHNISKKYHTSMKSECTSELTSHASEKEPKIKLKIKAIGDLKKSSIECSDNSADDHSDKKAKIEKIRIKNISTGKAEISEVIEEKTMIIQGEGNGLENNAGNVDYLQANPIVSEEIEEAVFYVYGEGTGQDNLTGNDSKSEDSDLKPEKTNSVLSENRTSKNSDETSNNSIDPTGETADNVCIQTDMPTSPAKSSFKLGKILDTKTDVKTNSPKFPIKKSRWDVESSKSFEDINNPLDEPALVREDDTVSNVKDLVNKWEQLSTSEHSHSSQAVGSSDVSLKNSTFYFGPGSSPFKHMSLVRDTENDDTTATSDKNEFCQIDSDNEMIQASSKMSQEDKTNENDETNEHSLDSGTSEIVGDGKPEEQSIISNVGDCLSTENTSDLKDTETIESTNTNSYAKSPQITEEVHIVNEITKNQEPELEDVDLSEMLDTPDPVVEHGENSTQSISNDELIAETEKNDVNQGNLESECHIEGATLINKDESTPNLQQENQASSDGCVVSNEFSVNPDKTSSLASTIPEFEPDDSDENITEKNTLLDSAIDNSKVMADESSTESKNAINIEDSSNLTHDETKQNVSSININESCKALLVDDVTDINDLPLEGEIEKEHINHSVEDKSSLADIDDASKDEEEVISSNIDSVVDEGKDHTLRESVPIESMSTKNLIAASDTGIIDTESTCNELAASELSSMSNIPSTSVSIDDTTVNKDIAESLSGIQTCENIHADLNSDALCENMAIDNPCNIVTDDVQIGLPDEAAIETMVPIDSINKNISSPGKSDNASMPDIDSVPSDSTCERFGNSELLDNQAMGSKINSEAMGSTATIIPQIDDFSGDTTADADLEDQSSKNILLNKTKVDLGITGESAGDILHTDVPLNSPDPELSNEDTTMAGEQMTPLENIIGDIPSEENPNKDLPINEIPLEDVLSDNSCGERDPEDSHPKTVDSDNVQDNDNKNVSVEMTGEDGNSAEDALDDTGDSIETPILPTNTDNLGSDENITQDISLGGSLDDADNVNSESLSGIASILKVPSSNISESNDNDPHPGNTLDSTKNESDELAERSQINDQTLDDTKESTFVEDGKTVESIPTDNIPLKSAVSDEIICSIAIDNPTENVSVVEMPVDEISKNPVPSNEDFIETKYSSQEPSEATVCQDSADNHPVDSTSITDCQPSDYVEKPVVSSDKVEIDNEVNLDKAAEKDELVDNDTCSDVISINKASLADITESNENYERPSNTLDSENMSDNQLTEYGDEQFPEPASTIIKEVTTSIGNIENPGAVFIEDTSINSEPSTENACISKEAILDTVSCKEVTNDAVSNRENAINNETDLMTDDLAEKCNEVCVLSPQEQCEIDKDKLQSELKRTESELIADDTSNKPAHQIDKTEESASKAFEQCSIEDKSNTLTEDEQKQLNENVASCGTIEPSESAQPSSTDNIKYAADTKYESDTELVDENIKQLTDVDSNTDGTIVPIASCKEDFKEQQKICEETCKIDTNLTSEVDISEKLSPKEDEIATSTKDKVVDPPENSSNEIEHIHDLKVVVSAESNSLECQTVEVQPVADTNSEKFKETESLDSGKCENDDGARLEQAEPDTMKSVQNNEDNKVDGAVAVQSTQDEIQSTEPQKVDTVSVNPVAETKSEITDIEVKDVNQSISSDAEKPAENVPDIPPSLSTAEKLSDSTSVPVAEKLAENLSNVPSIQAEHVAEPNQEVSRRVTRRSGRDFRPHEGREDEGMTKKVSSKVKKQQTVTKNKGTDTGVSDNVEPKAKKLKRKQNDSAANDFQPVVVVERTGVNTDEDSKSVSSETRVSTRRSTRFSNEKSHVTQLEDDKLKTTSGKKSLQIDNVSSSSKTKKTKQPIVKEKANDKTSDIDIGKKISPKKVDTKKRGRSQELIKEEITPSNAEESLVETLENTRTLRGGRKVCSVIPSKTESPLIKKAKIEDDPKNKETRSTRSGKPIAESPSEHMDKVKPLSIGKKTKTTTPNTTPKSSVGRSTRSLRGSSGSTPVPSPQVVSVIDCDTAVDSDVIEVQEKDPLAVSESDPEASKQSLSIDFNESSNLTAPSTRRSLRKRGLDSPEIIPDLDESFGKKPKIRGKRSADLQMRKSVEEKKKSLDISSSEDDVILISDSSEAAKTEPKKKSPPKKNKKGKVPQKKTLQAACSGSSASENPQPSKKQKILENRNSKSKR